MKLVNGEKLTKLKFKIIKLLEIFNSKLSLFLFHFINFIIFLFSDCHVFKTNDCYKNSNKYLINIYNKD